MAIVIHNIGPKIDEILIKEWAECQRIIRYYTAQGFIVTKEKLKNGLFRKPIPVYCLDYANGLIKIYIDYTNYDIILVTDYDLGHFRCETKLDSSTLAKLNQIILTRVSLSNNLRSSKE